MKRFFERHVSHLPQRMFGIVADLEDYPRFIPNCKAMEVQTDPAANGADMRLAKMTLNGRQSRCRRGFPLDCLRKECVRRGRSRRGG